MASQIKHVLFNFYHVCPTASDMVAKQIQAASDTIIGNSNPFSIKPKTLTAADPYAALHRLRLELCNKAFAKQTKDGHPIQLDEDCIETIQFLLTSGSQVSFIYRHPIEFAKLITDHAGNKEIAHPVKSVIQNNRLFSTHGSPLRINTYELAIAKNGFARHEILSVVGSEPNAQGSIDAGLTTWGYVGKNEKQAADLRQTFAKHGITVIFSEWGEFRQAFDATRSMPPAYQVPTHTSFRPQL